MELMKLFRSDKTADVALSGKEIALLECISLNGRSGICAADMAAAIAEATGKEPRLATLYATVLQLREKGLIEETGSAPPEFGGRPRRLFALTDRGRAARKLVDVLWDGRQTLVAA